MVVGFVSRKVLKLREDDLANYDLPSFNTLRGGKKWGERKQCVRLSLTILTTIDKCVDGRWGQDSILRLTRTHRKLLLSFSHWTPQQPAYLFITDDKLLRMSPSTVFASAGVFAFADEPSVKAIGSEQEPGEVANVEPGARGGRGDLRLRC